MSAVEKPVLFNYWRSSCAWRVRLVMNLKGIEYVRKTIVLSTGGEQFGTDYTAINPMQQVPALHIDGQTLIESLAILHYLEETRPQPPLMPQDVFKRAKVRAICDLIATGIQPMQNTAVLRKVGDEKEWTQHFINRGFKAIEKLLSTCAGKYCVGDEITLADCCLVPQVYNAHRFGVDLSPYPIIVRIDRELQSHAAFIPAHPSKQPDFPAGSHAECV